MTHGTRGGVAEDSKPQMVVGNVVTPVGEIADAPLTRPPREHSTSGPADFFEKFGLPILFVVVIAVFSLLDPRTFATISNAQTIMSSQSVLAVTALALMIPLVTGRFDISVGANLGMSAIVTATAMSRFGLPLVVAVILGILCGSLVGLFNGVLVSFLGINSIITTLGTTTVIGGFIQAYTGGIPISSGLSPILTNLSIDRIVGIPVLFLVMVVVGLIVWFLLQQAKVGRYWVAVGSNEHAAGLVGISVRKILCSSFIVGGVLAGVAGVLSVASEGNGNPQVGGIPFILPALAAVFLGATTIRPGSFNVLGTLIALFFLSAVVSGLTLSGAQPWVTDVFNGSAVILAVGLSAYFRRRRTGAASTGQ
jgi:ribose transport system permease protein